MVGKKVEARRFGVRADGQRAEEKRKEREMRGEASGYLILMAMVGAHAVNLLRFRLGGAPLSGERHLFLAGASILRLLSHHVHHCRREKKISKQIFKILDEKSHSVILGSQEISFMDGHRVWARSDVHL